MNKKTSIPFFTNVEKKLIPVSQVMRDEYGEHPSVSVLMFDDEGGLKKEECPVKYNLDAFDQVATIEVTTGKRNGYIILS